MSVEVKNLSFIYNQGTSFEKKALDSINIYIDSGEFVGLIGHTGSGKSTLIQHLNALIKPTSGTVLLNGIDVFVDKSKLPEIRQKVGLVFQYPEQQLFEVTVFKDVAYGPKNLGLTPEETDKRVRDALTGVGLSEEYYEKSPFELSGGEKRRVAIAGILAMNPEVLVLDEPAAGLDPKGRDEIMGQIKALHNNLGITVILVSHSMEDVAKLVDRVIVMDEGKIALTGDVSYIFSQTETLEKIGLAAPQITYLMKELVKRGLCPPAYENIYTIEAAFSALKEVLK